jgi:hypothetical protein
MCVGIESIIISKPVAEERRAQFSLKQGPTVQDDEGQGGGPRRRHEQGEEDDDDGRGGSLHRHSSSSVGGVRPIPIPPKLAARWRTWPRTSPL